LSPQAAASLLCSAVLTLVALGQEPAAPEPPAAAAEPSATAPQEPAPATPAPPTAEPQDPAPQPPADQPAADPQAKPADPAAAEAAAETPSTDKPADAKTADEKPADDKGASETSGLVDFQRDIASLLATRCLECHGPKQAKNDFRVDDKDSLLGYVEAGDSAASSLVTDYLITEDQDSLMPPASHGGPLPTAEIALIKLWIDEGASWPENAVVAPVGASESSAQTQAKLPIPESLAARLWGFQGFLHPATVHFPIALLILGAFAAIGSYLPGWTSAEPIAKFCLFFGAVSSVVACCMGWSFATERGYGNWTSTDGEIFWHRWSGIILAAFSVILLLLSWTSGKSNGRKNTWKLGMLVAAVIVGLVGHQGGELTYGKAMYDRAFEYLLGETNKDQATPTEAKPESSTETKPSPENEA